jgi:hypothetical protein
MPLYAPIYPGQMLELRRAVKKRQNDKRGARAAGREGQVGEGEFRGKAERHIVLRGSG